MSKILIITRQKANQRLLADYLGRQHDIIVATPAKAEANWLAQSETFDLGIVDGPALNQYASALEKHKSAEAPIFLPVLLITPRKDVRMVTGQLWRAVDDMIISPIEKVELQARVEILLRARHLSLELEQRNRENLQTSEARYRHIFEGTAVSIWQEDLSRVQESLDELKAKGVDNIEQYLQNHPDFVRHCAAQVRLLDINRASLKMFESNSKEDLLISLGKTFSPEAFEAFARALAAFSRHESRFETETVFQTLRGRPINVLLSIAFPPTGSPFRGTLVSMMDITARKQAEAALRESEAKFRSVIEQATDGVSLADEQGVVIEWNLSMATITGLPAEEVEGRYIWDVHAQLNPNMLRQADGVDSLKQTLINILKTGHMPWAGKIMESEYTHPDGSRRFIQGSIFPIKTDKGFMLVSFSRDATERRQAQEEILLLNRELEKRVKERTAQLEASNKELEAFAYSVSHDLRAPLRAIDGFTSILMKEYVENLDDEGKRLGDVIQKNAQKMGQLIDDLLAFSRLGRAAMRFSGIDMQNMATAIYHEVTSNSERQRIKFSVADLPDAYGDSNMLRQVWMNLISNAIKYSSKREKAVITITGMQDDEKTTYSISDNGAGFDIKYVNKIFEVFQRLHREEEYPGTGVGLSLVQRIINRHNGKIWAESEIDKGATFYFSLPNKVD